MNEAGERVPDSNLCVHSARAPEVVAGNAVAIGRLLRPTTGRYFYWGDDGRPGCRCEKCRELSDSEQALVAENYMAKALRAHDPRAGLAHLAYSRTLAAPRAVRPEPNVFLEYAPIARRYDIPYASRWRERTGWQTWTPTCACPRRQQRRFWSTGWMSPDFHAGGARP